MYTRNEKNTGPIRSPLPFFKQSVAGTAASGAGLTAVLYTTGILAANACLPVLAGMIVGVVPTLMINMHLSQEYSSRRIFEMAPRTGAIFNFLLRAATYTLGLLISLAVASMMVTLTMNPFTTPALIAGGVSAAIIISMYLFLSYKAGQSMNALRQRPMHESVTQLDPDWLSSTGGVGRFNRSSSSRAAAAILQHEDHAGDEGKYVPTTAKFGFTSSNG